MANRNFHRMQSLSRETKVLFAKVAIGATGAATLDVNNSMGVNSFDRDTAGVYDIVLDDKYNALLHVSVIMVEATAEDLTFQVESEDVDGAKTIKLQCKAAAVETDPSSGSVLLVKIEVKNSSVAR